MTKPIYDMTIIGSGIMGLLTAKQLRQAGATVQIIEKNATSQEASWAGGGILLPLYPWRQAQAITDLVIPSLKIYPTLAAELFSATGIDPEWTQCGLLISQNPDREQAIRWCESQQIPALPAETHFFSQLHSQPLHPLWLPTIAQARNPRLLKSLRAFLVQQGVQFTDNCTVTAIEEKNQRIQSVITNQGRLPVNELILATGAWTGELCEKLFPTLASEVKQVKPVKGQMLVFDTPPNLLKYMILEEDHYLIPRRDGKILAGSSVEHSGFDKAVTAATKERLYQFATRLLPALNAAPILHHWAGLRPGTEHGVPYIDRHPTLENLSLNAGHFRNGLTMAPASTQLLVDLILQRPPSVNPTPYRLMR